MQFLKNLVIWGVPLSTLLIGCGSLSAATSTVSPTNPPTRPAASEPVLGTTHMDARGIEQVWVPAGSFLMGTDEALIEKLKELDPPGFVVGEFATEQPQHTVRLTRGYWI